MVSRGRRRPAQWAGGPRKKGVVQPKRKVVIRKVVVPVDGTSERLLAGRSPKRGEFHDGASRRQKASPGLAIRRRRNYGPGVVIASWALKCPLRGGSSAVHEAAL